jgi:RND family efflux transporter MFP subunit
MQAWRRHKAWMPPVVMLLAACGHERPATVAAAVPPLQTLLVASGEGVGAMYWDGVVQAVGQSLLSAQASGRVTALPADVDQHVAAGAVLLRLTDEEQLATVAAARAQLRSAEAQLADAAARFQRASELVGRQLIARDDFDRIRAVRDSASAARDAAAAQLTQAEQLLGYTTVRAPYDGIIAARHVEPGETVAPGQPLFNVYAPGQLRVEVQVPQVAAQSLRGKPAVVVLPDGREVQAGAVMVYPAADPAAHSTTVRVQLPGMEGPPRPGQSARVRFAGSAAASGIWLPESAITTRGELTGAYVVDAQGIALRQLRLGSRAGGRVEVIAGLAAGERVASDPVAALQALQSRVAAAP